MSTDAATRAARSRPWTLLTNHGHVLLYVARNPTARVRDIAADIGITERAVAAILADLVAAEYLTRVPIGRRTNYEVNPLATFRHPAEADHQVGELLGVFC